MAPALLVAAIVLAATGSAAAQTPLPQVVALTIDPATPQVAQSVSLHVICDHSGPVALDDIDVAASIEGGATPNDFQDDVASNGGVDWSSVSTTPLPGAALRADRVGVFTWNGPGPGTITVRCTSSHGASVATLVFGQPPTTDTGPTPGTGPASSPPSFNVVVVPVTPPRSSLPRTGRGLPGLWIAVPVVIGGLLVVITRRRGRPARD
jgi:hypothetical protein